MGFECEELQRLALQRHRLWREKTDKGPGFEEVTVRS